MEKNRNENNRKNPLNKSFGYAFEGIHGIHAKKEIEDPLSGSDCGNRCRNFSSY